MDLFLFKKVVSQFLYPIPVVLALLLLAWLVLAWSRRGRRNLVGVGTEVLADYSVPKKKRRPGCFGMLLLFSGIFILYGCSTGLLVNQMFFILEQQYPPLQVEDEKVRVLEPEYIVILAGSHVYFPERPITSRLGSSTMARLVEGLRIHKQFPSAKVVMTGGVMKEGWPSVAAEMGEMARILGLEGEVILEEEARDTRENASLLKPVLQAKPFILVTSGYHMPRAMGLFRGQGLQPVAAAADIKRWPRTNYEHDQLIPSAKNLSRMSMALHEYLGLLWASWRGQLSEAPESEQREQEAKPVDEGEILVKG